MIETGKVKFFNFDKRFGFILPDDGSTSIFIHASGIAQPEVRARGLRIGQRVSFRTEIDQTGKPRAVDLEIIPNAVA